jgi:hypothetical protein
MKTKQEQIEEMAKIACATCAAGACCEPVDARPCDAALEYAEALYDAGYRKADEVRKETAREILDMLYDKCSEINDETGEGMGNFVSDDDILFLAKHYGVEIEK